MLFLPQVAVWGADNPGHNVRSNYLLKRVLDAYRHSPIEVYSMMDKGEKKVVEVFEKELGINRLSRGGDRFLVPLARGIVKSFIFQR